MWRGQYSCYAWADLILRCHFCHSKIHPQILGNFLGISTEDVHSSRLSWQPKTRLNEGGTTVKMPLNSSCLLTAPWKCCQKDKLQLKTSNCVAEAAIDREVSYKKDGDHQRHSSCSPGRCHRLTEHGPWLYFAFSGNWEGQPNNGMFPKELVPLLQKHATYVCIYISSRRGEPSPSAWAISTLGANPAEGF